ncbi:MAG TPA: hypothetical protein VJU86_15755 [Pyrinomonadaceae bacterium]|nr:hypothetical protein [Pyrinomonadaceae bacterium]
MKVRMILLTLAVLFSATVCLAQSPQMGTWKLNEEKSKFDPGASKNTTVVVEAVGDSVRVIVDGVDGGGRPIHSEWTGKIDGKFYSVTGDPVSDERSYRQISNRKWALAAKKNGKMTVTGSVLVSAKGNSRTVSASVTNTQGKRVTSRAVYDKQ